MKPRIFKKLCKKSAEIMNFNSCDIEDGIYHVWWEERGMDYCECDSEEAWTWILSRFDGDVNTIYSDDFDFGFKWKDRSQQLASTPKNVFAWAKKQDWLKRL